MLGERIAELRKSKGISQEELADVLLTSRQAISKWERGESDPDIARLKDLAVYFDVSIDYLLGYDVESTSVNNFIDRLTKCSDSGLFDISIDEIKMIVSRNNNNFNLIIASTNYIDNYYYATHDEGLLDLLIQYIKKAILLFQSNNDSNITLNDLHHLIASTYVLKEEYELAKEYIKENHVIDSNEIIAKCELAIGHYDEVDRLASDIFFCSLGSLINNNWIQIRSYLRTNRIKEALDLVDWSIKLVKSVGKNEEIFLNIIYMLSFIKASCEKALGLDYSSTLNFLKENSGKVSEYKSVNDGFRFFNNQRIVISSESADVKNDLLKEFNLLKKLNVSGYRNGFDIFEEVYGE